MEKYYEILLDLLPYCFSAETKLDLEKKKNVATNCVHKINYVLSRVIIITLQSHQLNLQEEIKK